MKLGTTSLIEQVDYIRKVRFVNYFIGTRFG